MEKRKEMGRGRGKGKVEDFTDLEVWQVARKLRMEIYSITRSFPKDELFGLVSQMRRAAVSATANIAEGYGRYSFQENIQFCRHARASVYELRDHFTSALDAEYLSKERFDEFEAMAMDVIRLVNGYIRSTRKRKEDSGGE